MSQTHNHLVLLDLTFVGQGPLDHQPLVFSGFSCLGGTDVASLFTVLFI